MCVKKEGCSCYDHFTRKFVKAGDSVQRGCNTCLCHEGDFKVYSSLTLQTVATSD